LDYGKISEKSSKEGGEEGEACAQAQEDIKAGSQKSSGQSSQEGREAGARQEGSRE
jgi:hypothetical protein